LAGRSSFSEDLTTALVLHEALQRAHALANRLLTASILECIALSRSINLDIHGARSHFAEAIAIYNVLGRSDAAANVGLDLGEAEFIAGDVTSALRYASDALEMARTLNDLPTVTNLVSNIAAYFVASGRYDDARAFAREALHLAFELQLDVHVVWAAQHFAAIAALQAQDDCEKTSVQRKRAAQLLGFVDKSLASLGVADSYTEAQEHDRVIAVLRDTISSVELLRLMATGAGMTPDKAVEYALSL
jgi:tetratricopeptide (TPR) repeat protein